MAKINDDSYLIACMQARIPVAVIAAKLGVTNEEVRQRWKSLQELSEVLPQNGFPAIADQWKILCNQYQLLGESLKYIGSGLGHLATLEDLRRETGGSIPDSVLLFLLSKFIVLHPYQAPSPIAEVERLEGN